MRLTVAASVLVGGAFWPSIGVSSLSAVRREKGRLISELGGNREATNQKKKRLRALLQSRRSDGRKTAAASGGVLGSLKNAKLRSSTESEDKVVECDPTLSNQADVGVLACDMDECCVESHDSTLGGICAPDHDVDETFLSNMAEIAGPERHLQYYSFGYFACRELAEYYDCDCTNWDFATSSGDLTCVIDQDYCLTCIPETCYSMILNYSYEESIGNTYGLFYDFSAPYTQNFTVNFYRTGRFDQTRTYGGECLINLDGVDCTSCYENSGRCVSYDCSNVGGESKNCQTGDYGDIQAPILKACDSNYGTYPSYGYYTPPPRPPIEGECAICSDGFVFSYKDDVISFPFVGNRTCGYLGAFAESGSLYGVACDYVTSFAEKPCCAFAPPSAPSGAPVSPPIPEVVEETTSDSGVPTSPRPPTA